MFVLQAAIVKGRGGIATAVAHYERMFRAVGVRSAVVFRGPSADALRADGVDVMDAPALLTSPFGAAPFVLDRLRAEVRTRAGAEPLLVIVHSDLALAALRRLFPGALFATPCHSDKFKRKRDADLVIALNQAQADACRAALPGARIALLGNPYVASPATPPASEGALRVNFVARFIPTKSPLTLIAAFAKLKARPCLRFIGAGPLEGEMRAAAAEANVEAEFAGWLSAPFSHFHRNDVLVLPSEWEGLPYLLQEALDHCAPIIAADNPGNRAALADGAYGALFPFGDALALARTIEGALADLDALRAKAEKGRAALHVRYGAEPFWRALTDELNQTPKRRDGRHA
ncbi:glycosyl transferase [alpha proteobacterium U9-1i]|nr:glycosyl transferase [alpha proteobacterium U9-1i]